MQYAVVVADPKREDWMKIHSLHGNRGRDGDASYCEAVGVALEVRGYPVKTRATTVGKSYPYTSFVALEW